MQPFLLLLALLPAFPCENVTKFPYSYPLITSTAQPYNETLGTKLWQFFVPYRMYASITINASFSDSDYFAIYNTANFIRAYNSPEPLVDGVISQNTSITYYFPGNLSTIINMTTSVADPSRRLSFSIQLNNFPKSNIFGYAINSTATVYPPATFGAATVFEPAVDGQTIMFSLATRTLNEYYGGSTDSCFVYACTSCENGTFIFGLMALSVKQMETTESTSFCCFDYNTPDYNLIAVAKPDFMGPNDTWISRMNESYLNKTVFLKNIEKTGAIGTTQYLTTYDWSGDPEYLESVVPSNGTNPSMSTIDIYIGAPSKVGFLKLTGHPLNTSVTWLPQEVAGVLRTYVARNGDMTLTFSAKSQWFSPSVPREGFVMTDQYSTFDGYQYAYTYMKTANEAMLVIDFNKTVLDLGPEGSFVVSPGYGDTISNNYTLSSNMTDLQLRGTLFQFQSMTISRGAIVYFTLNLTSTINMGIATVFVLLVNVF